MSIDDGLDRATTALRRAVSSIDGVSDEVLLATLKLMREVSNSAGGLARSITELRHAVTALEAHTRPNVVEVEPEAEEPIRPKSVLSGGGEWRCGKCDDLNEAIRHRCMRCQNPGPMWWALEDRSKEKHDPLEAAIAKGQTEAQAFTFGAAAGAYTPVRWECPECQSVNEGQESVCASCKHQPFS